MATRPSQSTILIGIVALVAVAAAAYFLVLKKDDSASGGGNGEVVTIEDLTYRVPQDWWTDAAGGINSAAQFEEDLNSPAVPKGPLILVERQVKASVDFEEAVKRPVADGATADKIKNGARYGISGKLTGSELRFVRKERGKPDVVGRSLYLRGKNVFGPGISILYVVPASQESKYNDAFKAFLDSLDLKNADNP